MITQKMKDDAIDCLKVEYCEACKGQPYVSESGCWESCEGFQEELTKTLKEWEAELIEEKK